MNSDKNDWLLLRVLKSIAKKTLMNRNKKCLTVGCWQIGFPWNSLSECLRMDSVIQIVKPHGADLCFVILCCTHKIKTLLLYQSTCDIWWSEKVQRDTCLSAVWCRHDNISWVCFCWLSDCICQAGWCCCIWRIITAAVRQNFSYSEPQQYTVFAILT